MAAKHSSANNARRRKQGPSSGTSAAKAKGKGPLGWPWWIIGAGFLLLCAGVFFMRSSKAKGSGGGSTSKGSAGKKPESKASSSKGSSTVRFLELALKLQEMTEVATTLEGAGGLDSDAAREIDKELTGIESEIADMDGSIARDLRAMVSVVRGTLYQRSEQLTDEQVENLQNSYTYANPRYWDDYYNKTAEAERFDWYGSWETVVKEVTEAAEAESTASAKEAAPTSTIGDLLRPYLEPEREILMLGCGNSNMSEQMYAAGFENIVNVDISEHLLENLRLRLGPSMPKMRWLYMNASALDFEAESFDVTIDKGTFDALEQNKPLLRAAAIEAHRTLRPGGVLLSVTFNSAPVRIDSQLREAVAWGSCDTHTFERARTSTAGEEKSIYYLHACRRPA